MDKRNVDKFVDVAKRVVKQDSIKTSLDSLPSSDYDNMYEIFKILHFMTEIELYSDKCGKKEM